MQNQNAGPSNSANRDDSSVAYVKTYVPSKEECLADIRKNQRKFNAKLMSIRAKDQRERKLAPSQKSPFVGNVTVKELIRNKKQRLAVYNPYLPEDKNVRKELTAFLKSTAGYPKLDKDKFPVWYWWWELITQPQWLSDSHMDAVINLLRLRMKEQPHSFRSDRLCLIDSGLSLFWTAKYDDFKKSEPNVFGLGKYLPPDSLDYFQGTKPEFCQTNKRWCRDIDDLYLPFNIGKNHWVALFISLPKRHITIWDSYPCRMDDEELATEVEPVAVMMAYMLREMALVEERDNYPFDKFTHERVAGVPEQKGPGDCGVYCLKYIECHATGNDFSASSLCNKNVKAIRSRYACDIFKETDCKGPRIRDWDGLDPFDGRC
ncbi:unnamed protein product [Microthlaspi erraticum]|uniref:Ubiquitin-like protease family profile domain-containing protein n=1 Tax=Microthlaspi erraticum TaxID=1685480 RepID=A0A6D2KXJ6_9BRAS|nr:unnamed protein product [Microthlaspi erraticum]CAA7061737.1 unnamed protein product [Microthlaspi erraticum]